MKCSLCDNEADYTIAGVPYCYICANEVSEIREQKSSCDWCGQTFTSIPFTNNEGYSFCCEECAERFNTKYGISPGSSRIPFECFHCECDDTDHVIIDIDGNEYCSFTCALLAWEYDFLNDDGRDKLFQDEDTGNVNGEEIKNTILKNCDITVPSDNKLASIAGCKFH